MSWFVSSAEISIPIETFVKRRYIGGAGALELRACTPSFRTHRCEAERLFASARNKGIGCAKRIEIPLCLHLPWIFFFFCVPFLFPEGQSVQSASFVRVPIHMSDTYVRMRNEKIASGERGDQCVMEDPLSFPLPSSGEPFAAVTGESRWMAGITLSATRLNRKLKNGRRAMKESRSCSGCYRRRSSPFVLLAISRLA